ncbi:MAG TPA: MerR family DNA-binding transcriptional regulator [Candidatus Scybalocola faecigallinarum]|uniref:MerR family DNA-binding transcriptional regulator n=1 Tax=Candidatus Scybalocola faecigallinarum TaxID=2840941 RepID=A0A9D1F300_9FIRM|nr:MerR family DNA-binding transcriptional regulator [Candidatus Scybalocola faecigallinarum]
MTIKEIEERSGMTRTNIRFYESEGLLICGRALPRRGPILLPGFCSCPSPS